MTNIEIIQSKTISGIGVKQDNVTLEFSDGSELEIVIDSSKISLTSPEAVKKSILEILESDN